VQNIVAIYENGVFRPLEPVDLSEGCRVTLRIVDVAEPESKQGLDAVYQILSERYASGHTDTAARHNEHQP
jgi:predicted DNA-binding antitoxin AbrB/MazE fold protein